MYQLIQISKINDFIFCPYSIYLHSIYDSFSKDAYQEKPQTVGTIRHENVDAKRYTTSKHIIQGMLIYSEKYKLIGKIDLYDSKKKELIERKHKVKQIFDGYKYQLYAQYLCLSERGFKVKEFFIHSLSDNKRYQIPLPNEQEMSTFKETLEQMWRFDPSKAKIKPNFKKCSNCIYSTLCDLSVC